MSGGRFNLLRESDIVICDEGDMYLKKHLLEFVGSELGGLITCTNLVMLFTATIDLNDELMLETNFPDNQIFRQPPLLEVSGTSLAPYEILGDFIVDEAQAIREFKAEILLVGKTKPVLVFVSDREEELFGEIYAECQATGENPCIKVDTLDIALEQRRVSRTTTRGVWLLKRDYSRGFDLKLNCSAEVYILDLGGNIPFTDIKQMAGRGCRSQGVCTARVWINTDKAAQGVAPFVFYESKSEVARHEGDQVVAALKKVWGEAKPATRLAMAAAFKEMKW